MIEFADLPQFIERAGPEGRTLLQLAESPVSKTLVGIVGPRVQFEIGERLSVDAFDLYVCYDVSAYDVRVPSPFAIVCIEPGKVTDPQSLFGELRDLLRSLDLHTKPVLLLHPGVLGALQPFVDLSETILVPLSSCELVGILLSHPPHKAVIRQVALRMPANRLNPYIYRGPIDRGMFVGRHQQLDRLRDLSASYALVGPRSVGKTSLINRAYELLRKDGKAAVRLELGVTMRDRELIEQFFFALVESCGVRESVMGRMTAARLQRLIQRIAHHSPGRRMAIFLDEADELGDRCPTIAAMLKLLHDLGDARVVLVGYKQLRKAISDAWQPSLMNVYQGLPLTRLTHKECGELVLGPLTSLEVKISDPNSVVDILFHDTGGGPSRIQLLCHALVAGLDEKSERSFRTKCSAC
jgi:hypothetical protein